MNGTRCLITGCRLVLPGEDKHAWGDLHSINNGILVFNACLSEGETAWEYGADPIRLPLNEKRVELPARVPYFERRGVVVFSEWQAHFNALAVWHLNADPAKGEQRLG